MLADLISDDGVVDDGFRDSVNFLKRYGLQVEMPYHLSKGSSQHSTEEANVSCLVTKLHWVIERVNTGNSQIKSYQTILQVQQVTVRIVCSLCNQFRPPLVTIPKKKVLPRRCQKCQNFKLLSNLIVEENNLLRRKKNIIENINDCPKLSLNNLRQLTLGVYQLKQAPYYTGEHMADNRLYFLFICKDLPNLIRVKFQSRHSNCIRHKLKIKYLPEHSTISRWNCTCKSGSPVVGTCAHVASVLWYLGYQRHTDVDLPKEV